MIVKNLLDEAVLEALTNGKLIVAPTDTIYGILARAESQAAVKRLYRVRQRPVEQPCIILVASLSSIPELTETQQKTYRQLSRKQPTTLITPAPDDILTRLPRQQGTLAFRLVPDNSPLSRLIQTVGPLLAPSANLPGQSPAHTVEEAIHYFGENVAVYVDGGKISNIKPSRIVKFNDTSFEIIRP